MRTHSVLPSKLAVAAFLVFGGFCLEVGLLIGSELCRVQCSVNGGHNQQGEGADRDILAAATAAALSFARTTPDNPLRSASIVTEGETVPLELPTRRTAQERGRLRSAGEGEDEAQHEGTSLENGAPPGAGSVRDERGMLGPSSLLAGAVHVKRGDFAEAVELGVPVDANDKQMDDVLILYTSNSSRPDNFTASGGKGGGGAAMISAERAVENCLSLKVVFTDKDKESTCLAVVGHPVESFHVHRFHRLPKFEFEREIDNIEAGKEHALRLVQRAVETDGNVRKGQVPRGDDMDRSLEELGQYLTKLKDTLKALKPVAEAAAASRGGNRTVVAMTVNEGQSDLFVNFVCATRSRGLDISHLVLFATDEASYKLASDMGVHAFEVHGAFGPMPTQAAASYGDQLFARMVLAKVYSVHLLVLLGYDVLLQDVDVVWLRNPLEFFHASRFSQYDMVFQDDGSRSAEFSPHFANTGCYFVRNNDRTKYFYNYLVRMGDVIRVLKCDQMAIAVALNEMVSWKGLRVKVLGRDTEDGMALPGGFHFHRRPDFMRKILRKEVEPYVFHMSWTLNKTHKRKFLSGMGEWYVNSTCAGEANDNFRPPPADDVLGACCSAQPIVRCHYRDVPSKIDCRDSDPIVKGRDPFWKEIVPEAKR